MRRPMRGRLLWCAIPCWAAYAAMGCDGGTSTGSAAPDVSAADGGGVADAAGGPDAGSLDVAPADATASDTASLGDAADPTDAPSGDGAGGSDSGPEPDADAPSCGPFGVCRPPIASSCGDHPGLVARPETRCRGPWPDDGFCCVPAGTCSVEGAFVYSGDLPCCDGLVAIPQTLSFGEGGCAPSRCVGCSVCVRACGDGVCTAGEDPCNCPADCPASYPGGPGTPCGSGQDCLAEAACLPEASGYPAGGYCTGGPCNPGGPGPLCSAGAICVAVPFAAAYLCLPSCHADTDCRPGLGCEALPETGPSNGETICWESSGDLGAGLGKPCAEDADCMSNVCLQPPAGGASVCSTFCSDLRPCKQGMTCAPMGGCGGAAGCGACF